MLRKSINASRTAAAIALTIYILLKSDAISFAWYAPITAINLAATSAMLPAVTPEWFIQASNPLPIAPELQPNAKWQEHEEEA